MDAGETLRGQLSNEQQPSCAYNLSFQTFASIVLYFDLPIFLLKRLRHIQIVPFVSIAATAPFM